MESSAKTMGAQFGRSTSAYPQSISTNISLKRQWALYVSGLLVNDVLMTGLAFLLAYHIRFTLNLPIFRLDITPSFTFYRGLSFVLILLWPAIFALNGLYDRRYLLGGTQEYDRVFRATSVGMLALIFVGFLEPDFILARGWLFMAWMLVFLLVAGGRFGLRRVIYNLRQKGYFLSPALIIGLNAEGRSLAQQLLQWNTSGLRLLGFIDDRWEAGEEVQDGLRVLGNTSQIEKLIDSHAVEELIITTSALTRNEIVALFRRYGLVSTLNVRLSSGLFEVITTGLELKEMASVPLVRVNKVRLKGFDRFMKSVIDYTVTLSALPLLLPLFGTLALLIRLDSKGPALYRRRVMGVNGREFDAFKFRTMYTNGDEILNQHPELKAALAVDHKLREDPRITRVGNFLRKTSLDELPQLLNVLLGDMSLIGPRMISPPEMEKYNQWGLNLLTVKPGITGLWQVSGRSDVSYEERISMDMHYIRNWTIWMDLHILWQTVPAVLQGRGAY